MGVRVIGMNTEESEGPISIECVGDCKGHAARAEDWTEVTVVGSRNTALANVYQVAVAGEGGTATCKAGCHGIVAVASKYGHAISGDGGVAVSSGQGTSSVESWGYAYSNRGRAKAGPCSVAGTTAGFAEGLDHGIGVGWSVATRGAQVVVGKGGVAIGDVGTYLKAGEGGVLIAMAVPALGRDTKISRVEKGGIVADRWYLIEVDNQNVFMFTERPAPLAWQEVVSPCLIPPKPCWRGEH